MTWIANRFPAFSRHARVFAESWREQNEADKTFKKRDEHEFLPAALEIMTRPPSPGLRWLLLLTCALFVLAIIWAIFGKIDVVATAAGKTVPSGNVKLVQPIEIGAVRAIHVRNGQFVRKGDLLIELDPTLATADAAQSSQSLQSAEIIRARNDALLAHVGGTRARFVSPVGAPSEVSATQQSLVDSTIEQYEAQRSSLVQQRAENAAQLAAANAEIAKLREALPYIDKQLSARAKLAEKGFFSNLKLLEFEQLRAEHVRNIDVQEANAAKASASIGRLDAELRALRANFSKTAATERSDAREKAGLAGEELRKAERRRQFQELRAPVDGVVQQIVVTTVGGVVQPAQPLMVIVPCAPLQTDRRGSCSADVSVEVLVQNKDIGFVKEGQRVAVKLEAFNFTDFGLIEGTVTTLSRDAIDQSQVPAGSTRDGNGRPVQTGLVYAAKIKLRCELEDSARVSLCDRVMPGMAVQAEIKTGRRRIIQYLLSPITQAMDEAGKER